MSQFLSNQQLCKFAGWRPGSGQFEVYVHLTNEDVNEAIRKRFRLGGEAVDQQVSCPICGHANSKGALECHLCKRPLNLESATRKRNLQNALEVLGQLQEQGKLESLLQALAPSQ